MTSALVLSEGEDRSLAEDLCSVGIEVIVAPDNRRLLHDTIAHAPDLIVVSEDSPGPDLFEALAAVNASAPRPVVVFTFDPDAEKIALATRSGVHAYVVNGYGRGRLRSVIHLAQARFRQDQRLREELVQVNQRFAERKLVDRAKGILMGARQLREEEAYRALRRAAMHTKQRIGQVSQQVIDSARYAEAINRAGQMRMLSQRLVKLYALLCVRVRPEETRMLLASSLAQADANLSILAQSLSRPTFGDLLDAVLGPWKALHPVLEARPMLERLAELDGLAEEVLLRSERLTANLEIAGFAAALHVINVVGRQRMLSQRLAKGALLAGLLEAEAARDARAGLGAIEAELLEGFAYLDGLPLSNGEIAWELGQARQAWAALQAILAQGGTGAGQDSIAVLSETLLAHLDRLTEHFERGMQALIN